ncbi:P2X purinoceptor 1 isoform X1 [Pimephales promelas]|uniref:P2X purinoceptor 1 isoform X1 n=1 Tax=Pimephales promelas TaxID=90988 RepID=UPI001955DE44|nr:P2X purinoceptor 1 isoform X1 [Pimephales promelas]KAG1926518.1 P2X purinoceptor [Pimephales promelas]
MRKMKSIIQRSFSNFFFEYETPRQVLVRNRRVAVVCRIIQLGVLSYIIGWVFMYEKGYQTVDTAISSVFTKMKGVSYTNISNVERIWDAADYVFPEQGDSSFVVMTNYISSVGQEQGTCPELPDEKNRNKCTSDTDCDESKYKRTGNGYMTGKCNTSTSTCEIYSWCPVEDDRQIPDPPILQTAENYTLFIKNSITFRQFNVVRSNLVESVDQNYINNCLYHPKTDALCPIFRLGDIVERSGFNFSDIARVGGAIGILVDWDCNLDLSIRHCKPRYEFYGLYGTGRNEKVEKPSLGYNFRYAKYYMENNVEKRTLMKVFGVRIDIIVHGRAGKFDIIPTLTAIGSGVGIFGVATVVCDLLLLYLLPKRDFYKSMKFKHTEVQEAKPTLPPSQKERELPKE